MLVCSYILINNMREKTKININYYPMNNLQVSTWGDDLILVLDYIDRQIDR